MFLITFCDPFRVESIFARSGGVSRDCGINPRLISASPSGWKLRPGMLTRISGEMFSFQTWLFSNSYFTTKKNPVK